MILIRFRRGKVRTGIERLKNYVSNLKIWQLKLLHCNIDHYDKIIFWTLRYIANTFYNLIIENILNYKITDYMNCITLKNRETWLLGLRS